MIDLGCKMKATKMTGKLSREEGGRRRWLWAVNSGVIAATSQGHPVSENRPKRDGLEERQISLGIKTDA